VGVKEAGYAGHTRKSRVHHPFQDLGEGLKENYEPERGGRVILGLTRFVEHDAVRAFDGGEVEAMGHQRSEKILDQVRHYPEHPLPNRVGRHVRPGGQ